MKRSIMLGAALLACMCMTAVGSLSLATTEKACAAETAEMRGLVTTITVNLSGENGYITAEAKNTFTLFSSTVETYLFLYSSEDKPSSYKDMTIVNSRYTADLDMGDSLTITVSTGGEQKYWLARVRYKVDNKDFVEKTTAITLYDADGNAV